MGHMKKWNPCIQIMPRPGKNIFDETRRITKGGETEKTPIKIEN